MRLPVLLLSTAMLLATLQRFALCAIHRGRFAEASWAQLAQAFAIGIRFDLVVSAMLVAPLLLLVSLAPLLPIERRSFEWVAGGLAGILLGFETLLLAADAFFFAEFGERLNHKVLHYAGGDGNEYVLQVILDQFPVLPVLGGALVVTVLAVWPVMRFGFGGFRERGPAWHGIVWPAALAALLTLGIRGTTSSHAINTGPAYFSSASSSLPQLTLNGLFTLRQAVYARLVDDRDLAAKYDLLPDAEVDRRARTLVFAADDQPIENPGNPLHRLTHPARPVRDLNVVVVVMEGLHAAYVGHLGGRPGLTPNLDALAEAGVHARHAYAVGGRTQRGFAGIVSSFPDLPGASVTTRNELAGNFLTLPGLLKRRGYETLFIYGGPAHRDHRQTFLGSNGVDRFVVEDDLPVRTFRTRLGWNDRDLFRSAIQVLDGMQPGRPFFALLLTLTFHRPYEFPGDHDLAGSPHSLERQSAALRFSDAALGEFMRAARRRPWFDETIFVFVADHRGGRLQHPRGPATNRIPLVFYGPGIEGLEPRGIGGIRSQMDLAPTVMGLLGGAYEHSFFGRDLLRTSDRTGYAFTVEGDGELSLYTNPREVTVVPPENGQPMARRFDPESAWVEARAARRESVRDAVALVQLADRLFREQRFDVIQSGSAASPNPTASSKVEEAWSAEEPGDADPATAVFRAQAESQAASTSTGIPVMKAELESGS